MDELEAILQYQENRVNREMNKETQLQLLKRLFNRYSCNRLDILKRVKEEKYIIQFLSDEFCEDVEKLLELDIVKDTHIHSHDNGFVVSGTLDFDPLTVAQDNYNKSMKEKEKESSNE